MAEYLHDFMSVDETFKFDGCLFFIWARAYEYRATQSDKRTTRLQNEVRLHTAWEQVKGKKNALHVIVRDLHYCYELVSGKNKHF